MDDFLALERAAHDGAFGRDNHVLPTPAAAEADNYRKGFVRLHDLDIAIENPRCSIREGTSADGTPWANRMAAHYGYFIGTVGADGDGVDVFIGPYPESKRVWVINQMIGGRFDEHKVMLAFPDADNAKAAYVNSYTRDWKGFGSMVAMNLSDFKQWLGTNPQTPAVEKPVDKILWSGDAPRALTFDAVLYQIRRHDADGLIFDAVTEGELLQDADEVLTPDAMTSPYQQLPKRAQLLMNMMNRVGDPQVTGFTITKPYRVRGIINIAVIYTLTDGQTLTVYFHTGGSNIRVQPDDELISWKWMLNKLDVTIAVAPEQGVELDLRTVARRLMQLAIKNSPTFAKQNAKKAETLASIDALKGQIVAAEMELADVQGQIAAKREEQRIARELADAQVAREQAAESGRKLPTSAIDVLRSMGAPENVIRDAYPYDTFDAYAAAFPDAGKPIIAQRKTQVRNALRQLGWDGDMYRPLSLGVTNATYVLNFTDRPDLRIELGRWTGAQESGVAVYDDDLMESAEAMAKIINDCAREDATNLVDIDEAARAAGEPPVGAPNPEEVQDKVETPAMPDVTEVVAAAVATEQAIAAEVPQAEMAALEAAAPINPPPVAPEVATQEAEDAPRAGESLLTYDMSFLQSVIDGTINLWADGLAERIESIMQAHPGNDELHAKAACAIDVYTRTVIEAARTSLDAIEQVPDPLHDTPPAGERANESEVQTDEQKAAAAIAVRQQNGADWPTPVTTVPVPEKSSLDTALVEPGNPTGVLTPPAEPLTPEQATGESGGVPVPEVDVSGKLAEQPAAPDMPSIDKPVETAALDTAASDVAQIEPTESNAAPAGLIQIQENGQSEPILAEAKAEVGAELLATAPNEPIQVPDVEPAPEIKPVPESMPQPETPTVIEANPLPVQGDTSAPLDASPAAVPEVVADVPPTGEPTVAQVPDPLHDTPPPPEQAAVDIPVDPAQVEAEQPNEVVRREADQAYLDSVIDGSERGESARIGALFETYEKDEPMLDKWREAVAAFTLRIK
ncbi:defense against restriction DarA-related protein [Paraburkholderia dipogonis]|uniref:defense against restriction DarA-related protein n=1 Tax=Paraburkholderia dipogonis TaxID=1211383 RepID=UPI0038B9B83D